MPLTSFSDAHEDASPIAKQTRSRDMPPWLPDTKACAPLGNDDEMCLAFLYATPSL